MPKEIHLQSQSTKEKELKFELVKDEDKYPYDLLLLADETIQSIHEYVFKSEVFVVRSNEEEIGAFCLYKTDQDTVELKNVAVARPLQSKGIGTQIIDYIKQYLKNQKYRTLVVGTADIGIRQIKFYEKNGFLKYDIRQGFYVENYEKPIFEDGVQLKDMVLLKYQLQ